MITILPTAVMIYNTAVLGIENSGYQIVFDTSPERGIDFFKKIYIYTVYFMAQTEKRIPQGFALLSDFSLIKFPARRRSDL